MKPPALAWAALAALAAIFPCTDAGASQTGGAHLDERQALAVSREAIGRAVGDHVFVDHNGARVSLAQLRGKPLIVPMVYTSCYHTCPLIAHSLLQAVVTARQVLPRDSFQVAVVGFEAGVDTPERMRAFAKSQGLDQPGWIFLSGNRASVDALAQDIGFSYVRSPRGFDHVAQTTIIGNDGRVYRQVYGADFKASAVLEPLKQLVFGRPVRFSEPSTWWDRVRLLCTVYDPAQDRYRFSYAIFMSLLIGIGSLGGVAWVVLRILWRRPLQGA